MQTVSYIYTLVPRCVKPKIHMPEPRMHFIYKQSCLCFMCLVWATSVRLCHNMQAYFGLKGSPVIKFTVNYSQLGNLNDNSMFVAVFHGWLVAHSASHAWLPAPTPAMAQCHTWRLSAPPLHTRTYGILVGIQYSWKMLMTNDEWNKLSNHLALMPWESQEVIPNG